MTVLLHFLVPRSRKHAYIQITACIVIFHLFPGILPDWYYFLLTFLFAVLLTGSVRSTFGTFASAGWQRDWTTQLDYLVAELQWHTRAAKNIVGGAVGGAVSLFLFCTAGAVYALGNCNQLGRRCNVAMQEWSGRGVAAAIDASTDGFHAMVDLGLLTARTAVAVLVWAVTTCRDTLRLWLTSLGSSIRWLCLSVGILLLKLSRGEFPETELYLFRRRFRLAMEDAAETVIDVVEGYHIRLVWVLLCIAHFLSFTLGLTVLFPCLFIYGTVVSFVYLAAHRGSAGLITKALSWVNF